MNLPLLRRQLEALDLERPWWMPYSAGLRAVRLAVLQGEGVAAALSLAAANADSATTIPQFVPAACLPPGEAYEAFVARSRTVPCRDNLHDLFNGLVWLRFPHAKWRINALQAAEIARQGIGPVRGAVRDALTLFDENGVLLAGPTRLWDALTARDWRKLFVEWRPLWHQAGLVVFGHALLEKLATPRKQHTAHVWAAEAPAGQPGAVDTWLASQLTADALAAKPFTPLPVLGVPGWSAGNENFSFYDDSLVFRSRRTPESTYNTKRLRPPSRPLICGLETSSGAG